MNYFLSSLHQLQQHLNSQQLLLISRDTDILYLTGFSSLVNHEREAYLVISKKQINLFYSAFSPIKKFKGIHYQANCFFKTLVDFLKTQTEKEILIDEEDLWVTEYLTLKKLGFNLLPFQRQQLWQLRQLKNPDELKKLALAGQLSQQAWQILQQQYLVEGISEVELARQLECLLLELGADGCAFPTIVAFGPHTALAHHQPTSLKLKTEMPVLIDFGAKKNGYGADMTRTIWFGQKPDAQFLEIKKIVKEAYQSGYKFLQQFFQVEAITAENNSPRLKMITAQTNSPKLKTITAETHPLKIGQHNSVLKKLRAKFHPTAAPTAKQLDEQIRDFITQAGFGKQFIHTSGHGIGLDIHEPPSIFYRNNSPLQANMAITLEPGIYLPDQFGVRYENSIVLK